MRHRASRIQACRGSGWSRLVENVVEGTRLAGSVCGVGLAIEGGGSARCRVGFHLTVPIVVGPAAQFGDDLGAFFKRETLNRRPDFLNRAHTETLCPDDTVLATRL